MMTSNLKRNMKAIGWLILTLLFLVPSVASAAVNFQITGVSEISPNEGSGDHDISFQVTMTGDSLVGSDTAAFTYELTAGSPAATIGDDYSAVGSTTVSISSSTAAPYTETVYITIHGDSTVEQNEVFQIRLTGASSSVSGGATFDNGTTDVTITNDDSALITVAPSATSGNEGATGDSTAVTYTATLSASADVPVSFEYSPNGGLATAGTDYTGGSGTVNWVAGASGDQTFDVTIVGDNTVELDEDYSLQFDGLSNSGRNVTLDTTGATYTIENDDLASLGISYSGGDVAEGTSASFQITEANGVTLDQNYTISLTYGGDVDPDADLSSHPVSVAVDGDTTFPFTFDIPVATDDLIEGPELLTVGLVSPEAPDSAQVSVGGTASCTITSAEVADINITASTLNVSEMGPDFLVDHPGASMEIQFTVQFADSTLVTGDEFVEVAYQTVQLAGDEATSTADYLPSSGTLRFTSSDSNPKTVTIVVLNDHLMENDEAFEVHFARGTNAGVINTTVFPITIRDNDVLISPVQERNGGSITIADKAPWADHIADIGEHVAIRLDWVKGLNAYTISGASAIGTIGNRGSTGLVSGSGEAVTSFYDDEWTVVGLAGDEIEVDARFRHAVDIVVGENGRVNVNPPGTDIATNDTLIVNDGQAVSFQFNGDEPVVYEDDLYCVSDVRLDGDSIGAITTFTLHTDTVGSTGGVTEDHEIAVDFRSNRLQVIIYPSDVTDADDEVERGQWRLLDSSGAPVEPQYGGDWNDSGHSARIECLVSNFTIEFKTIPGWFAPPQINVTVDTSTTGELIFPRSGYPDETTYTPKTFVLTLENTNPAWGDINLAPVGATSEGSSEYTYQSGSEVQLSAVPADGYVFSQWQGAVSSSTATITVTMDSDKTIRGVFNLPSPDNDGDGFDASVDCNDNDPGIFPGALEICGDGVDQDCSGADLPCGDDDEDNDGDGFSPSQGDCNDNDPTIYPGAVDIPGDGIDQDCYGGDQPMQTSEVTCVVPAETPLETQVQAAPPLIMFLIDDSGSMDFEFMTDAAEGGYATGSGTRHYLYPRYFDDKYNDNVYTNSYRYMTEPERRLWQSQWSGKNKLYFDPSMTYTPWPRWNTLPGTDGSPGFNAHPDEPRMNPVNSSRTLDLSTTLWSVNRTTTGVQTQYIWVRKDSSNGNRWVAADAIRLVDTSDPGTSFMVDNGGGNSANGYYTENTPSAWSDLTDGIGGDARLTRSTQYHAYWHLKVPAGTYDVEVHIPSIPDLSYDVDYEYGNSTTGAQRLQQGYDQRTVAGGWGIIATDLTFIDTRNQVYEIPVAHYFVHNDDGDGVVQNGEVYLVVVDDQHIGNVNGFTYYRFNDPSGDNRVDDGDLEDVTGAPPAGIIPVDDDGNPLSYAEVRQNFANWYSFYRRRELTAKAAIGQVIDQMEEVKIGLSVINSRSSYNHEVQPVKLNGVGDETETLLNWLYAINSDGGTPLRRGLQDVGQYFDLHESRDPDNDSNKGLGTTPPWSNEAEGGGCQRAFVIAMTDGYWNGSDSGVESPLRDLNADADGVNREGQMSGYDQGVFTGPNYGSSPNLGDIAMYYYENDLNRSLSNVVPTYKQDNAPHQHMVTYGVAFGVVGENNPDDYPNCLPKCEPGAIGCPEPECPAWPVPRANTPTVIDDLYHASVNGRGQFFTADDPQQLINSLIAVMQSIQNTAATGSSVAINAQELQGDTALYQATYIPRNWTGDVVAKPLDPTTGGVVQALDANNNYVDQVDWSAAEELDSKTWTTRKVITFNDASQSGAIFDFNTISAAQRDLLDPDPATAEHMVDFLRGDISREIAQGGVFRDRESRLGDVVHASPVPYRWDADQPGVIFVGANDGMLHVLDETTGDERFAYMPNLVFANLKALTVDPYVHKYFVDSEPYIAKLGTTGSTILVGGLGRGGRGYYCLDIGGVSNAALDAETSVGSIVKWEYPINSDPENKSVDPDMGYSFSQAYAVDSAAGWVVIFGNGYDSQSGEAVLYVLRINSDGSLVSPTPRKIRTYVGDSDPNCNGLSTPALIDVNLDGLVDFAFAGDLLGNMWKFDLRDSNVNNWTVAYNEQADGTGMPKPLFQARNASGFRQPITTRPDIMRPCTARSNGYFVLFGTGRYLGISDFADAGSVQTIYGVWDWAEAWENLGPLASAERRNAMAKYLGYFNTDRQLSNLVANSDIPDTDQTVYVIDLSGAAYGDTVTINSRTFTAASLTDVTEREFLGTAGLRAVIEDATNGVPDVTVEVSPNQAILRTDPPGGTISVNVSGGITREAVDLKVSLLNQSVIFHQGDYLVVSDNPIDLFSPRTGRGQHVGWYFDLPGTSERLVNDVIVRGGILYAVPTVPSDSPCEAGGTSIVYAFDACNGGRALEAVFDINGDYRVNSADLINIGTAANPIWVAPTGLRHAGLLFSPAILSIPGTGTDILHFSTSGGNLESEIAVTEKLGFLYWRTW